MFVMGILFAMLGTEKRKKNSRVDTNIEENERLAVSVCSEKTDYTEIRQIMDYLLRSLDIKYDVRETSHKSFIDGRVARVSINGKNVAYIGEIHPQVLVNWELEMPATAFELNLTELFTILNKK